MSPLKIKAFRDLWLGQAISQAGDSFYFIIFAFMVQKVTGSEAMVGYTCALELLPFLLLSPYAGVLADRLDRKRIMLISDIMCVIILSLFAAIVLINGKPPVWAMMATACCTSLVRVFFFPAKSAAVPALVPDDMLMKATSISQATQNIMPLLSLPLSATVLMTLYKLSPNMFLLSAIGLNLLSFAGSAIFVAKLPKIEPKRTDEVAHPMQEMRDGFEFMKSRHDLKMMLGLQLLLNLMISPFFVVYLTANKHWFGDNPANLAWCEFSFFVGMVSSSFLVGKLKIKRVGLSYIAGVAGVGLGVAAMAFSREFWMFIAWNILAGLSLPFAHIPVTTYLQLAVPDAFRGRVNSAWSIVTIGVQPIGMALGGNVVQAFGLVGAFLTMGLGMSGAGALGLLDRKFRRLEMPDGEAVVEVDDPNFTSEAGIVGSKQLHDKKPSERGLSICYRNNSSQRAWKRGRCQPERPGPS